MSNIASEVQACSIKRARAVSNGVLAYSKKRYCCDAAILVSPKDPKAIAAALEQLLVSPDLVASLGKRARTRLEQHCSWEAVTRRYESSMHELVESRKSNAGPMPASQRS